MAEYNPLGEFVAAKRTIRINGATYAVGDVVDTSSLVQTQLQRLFFWGLIAPAPAPEPEPVAEPA